MNAPALLAELDAAGISVTREGDTLRVRAIPGVSITPYLARIKAYKPVLLRELLQRRIVAALDVEPDQFDRAHYLRLWTQDTARAAEKEESRP